MPKLLLILFLNIVVYHVTQTLDFTYEKNGAAHWSESYKQCSGKHQSPININELTVEEKRFPVIERFFFYTTPKHAKIMNNGHTVVVRLEYAENETPTIAKGPLIYVDDNATFVLSQFHFHWGSNDKIGSEDRINNQTFPAELHIVFHNKKYANFTEATKHEGGVAVMAYFFRITPADNKNYEEFTELLEKVRSPDTEATFKKPPALFDLLNKDHYNYYVYMGSLTTPPCSEDVLWVDFITPIPISQYQISRFRQLYAEPGVPLMNNFRPVQPLNDRVIARSINLAPSFGQNEPGHGIPLVNFASSAVSCCDKWLSVVVVASLFAGLALLQSQF